MLRFCSSCKTIIQERDMHTDDICSTCYSAGAEERKAITDEVLTESSEASTGTAGEGESGPYLPGMAPAQEIEGGKS